MTGSKQPCKPNVEKSQFKTIYAHTQERKCARAYIASMNCKIIKMAMMKYFGKAKNLNPKRKKDYNNATQNKPIQKEEF